MHLLVFPFFLFDHIENEKLVLFVVLHTSLPRILTDGAVFPVPVAGAAAGVRGPGDVGAHARVLTRVRGAEVRNCAEKSAIESTIVEHGEGKSGFQGPGEISVCRCAELDSHISQCVPS